MDSPTRWDTIGQKLQKIADSAVYGFTEQPRYLSVRPRTWEALTRHYFAEELAERESVDRAVRTLAKTGAIPANISTAARYYVLLRMGCANDFLGMVFPPQSDSTPFADVPDSWTETQVIEWLLIDLWQRRFDHYLKLTAISLAGPFAFYGIEPADPNVPS